MFIRREATLYVDYDWLGGCFVSPSESDRQQWFHPTWGPSELSKTQTAYERLRTTDQLGLYRSEVLNVVNEVFAGTYIKEDTDIDVLERLYGRLASRVGITSHDLRSSALWVLPLYHFTTAPKL